MGSPATRDEQSESQPERNMLVRLTSGICRAAGRDAMATRSIPDGAISCTAGTELRADRTRTIPATSNCRELTDPGGPVDQFDRADLPNRLVTAGTIDQGDAGRSVDTKGCPFVLRVLLPPFRARAPHVVQLRPVGVVERSRQPAPAPASRVDTV